MKKINITLVYCTGPVSVQQKIFMLSVNAASSIRSILQKVSLEWLMELEKGKLSCGVFGQKKSLEDLLEEGDRLEIYRPLSQDPKTARLERINRDRS
jgi:uncharacterized protein